ncbi:MAG TPA: response regulator [Limnobacter sp.]|nr:response regulator [Limnobacter sp.]
MPRVMIVEDDITILTNMAQLLSLSGLHVLEAHDGLMAIKMLQDLKSSPERQPCLIISDLMMPNMDGYELLRAVRKDPVFEALPFVLLSARSDSSDIQRAFALGASDYLVKPFEVEQLMDLVRYHLRQSGEEVGSLSGNPDGDPDFTLE